MTRHCERCGRPDRPTYRPADRRRIGLAMFATVVTLGGLWISDHDDRTTPIRHIRPAAVVIGTPASIYDTTTTMPMAKISTHNVPDGRCHEDDPCFTGLPETR